MMSSELLIFLMLLQNCTTLVSERKRGEEERSRKERERVLNLIHSDDHFYDTFFKIMLFHETVYFFLIDIFQFFSLGMWICVARAN